MNQELRGSIVRWTREAEELQRQLLLAAAEGAPALRKQLLDRLSPWDFSEGTLRDQFAHLYERWAAARAKRCSDELISEEAECDLEFHEKIERLVRLIGTIRLMRLFSDVSQILETDLKQYDSLLEGVIKEVSARSRRLAALRVDPAVWKTSKARTCDVITRIEQRVLKRQPAGERIGWADIFDLTFLAGEFQPGRLYLLGSRPGEGKTAFVSMLARAASISKKRVGFIALRDSEESVSLRFLGGEAQCHPIDFHTGKIEKEDIWRLACSARLMSGTFPAIAALPDPSTICLCEFAKELKASKKLQFLAIDDVGFAFSGHDYPDKQGALMARIARLRELARQLQIPVVATVTLDTSHICEDLPGIAPTPEDVLRFSSADFLAVLTATQNQEGDPIHEFEILQNPFGPTAKIPLVYQRRHQRFYELAEESRMEEDRF
ncbi:MAG: DnaB-like helicase C-terminal domain-containing protein [Verrucomicrobiota bacterium]